MSLPTPPPTAPSAVTWNDRRVIVVELLAVVAMFAADFAGIIPLSKTPFLVLIVWISLRVRGQSWKSVGLSRPRSMRHALMLGVVAGVVMELLADFLTTPLLTQWLGGAPDLGTFREVVGNLPFLGILLALNWPLAAFGEELVYRGFLMARLATMFGDSRRAWWMSLLLANVVFGFAHGYQGPTGVIQEGLNGVLLGLLFRFSGGNLMLPMIAHGVSNSLAFVLMYLDRYPWPN
jgi:uncharacterized protein